MHKRALLLLLSLIIVVSILTLVPRSGVMSQATENYDASKSFIEANHLFSQGNYEEAASLYEKITTSIKNGQLYYNLGNAYLKLGKVGAAILSYRNAQAYSPRDQDLRANLRFARQLTKDKIDPKSGGSIIRTICFWYDAFNQRELLLALLVINGLFWAVALLRIWFRHELLYWSCLASFVLLIIIGATLSAQAYQTKFRKEAVVTTAQLAVRAGNGLNNTVLFYLHEGTEFRITGRNTGWVRIELPDGKIGWVQTKFVGIVGE